MLMIVKTDGDFALIDTQPMWSSDKDRISVECQYIARGPTLCDLREGVFSYALRFVMIVVQEEVSEDFNTFLQWLDTELPELDYEVYVEGPF